MPRLSEKQPGSLLCCFCPPLPLPGASETRSPLRLLAFNPAPIQEVTEILMCRQKRLSEARAALDLFPHRILMHDSDG